MHGFSDGQKKIINDQFEKMIKKLKKKLGSSNLKNAKNESDKE